MTHKQIQNTPEVAAKPIVDKLAGQCIEVIRGGGATSLWGNMATGGVINTVVHEPQKGQHSVQVGYGNHNTWTLSANTTLYASRKFQLGFNLATLHTGGCYLTPRDERNKDSSATRGHGYNALVSAYFHPTDRSTYYLNLSLNVKHSDGLVWRQARNSWKKYGIWGGGRIKLTDNDSLHINGWFNHTRFSTQNATLTGGYSLSTPRAGYAYVSQRESAPYDTGGGSLYWAGDLGPIHKIKAGVDFRMISVDDRSHFYAVDGMGTATFQTRAQHYFEGIFAQGTYRAIAIPIAITLGVRGNFWQARPNRIKGQTRSGSVDRPLAKQSAISFGSHLGVRYDLPAGFALHGAVYRDFSAPGMNHMYRSYISGSRFYEANASLRLVFKVGEEIGLDYKHDKLGIQTTLFHNRLDHYIDEATVCTSAAGCAGFAAEPGPNGIDKVRQYQNVGKAIIEGLEVLVDYSVRPSLFVYAGYTRTIGYLTSSNTPGVPTHQQLGLIPGWVLLAGARWRPLRDLNFTLQLKHFPNYWHNTEHTVRSGGATLVNLSAHYRLSPAVTLFALVRNLGGDKYDAVRAQSETTPAQLGEPRTVLTGVELNF